MDVKEIISKVQSSAVFKDWYKEHGSAYLAHIFFIEGESYDIGYYLKSEDRMASFCLEKDVSFKGFSEVFKHPDHTVKELDISTVDVGKDDALDKAASLQEEQYSAAKPFKRVVILQHLDQGQVWNITFVTQNFKTLNIKIDAKTGEIIEHRLIDIIQKAI